MIPEVKDRNVQFPNRYRLVKTDTGEDVGTYDFVEETGEVYEEGTVVDAELLNTYKDYAERAEKVDIAFFERLKAEEEGREKSETAINERIAQEQERAETAEDGLQANIEAEESTRVSEIERVEGLIDAQNDTLTGEIARLDDELNAETLSRQGEITRVEGLVADEKERATTQEGIIDDKIDAETNRAKGKEKEIDTAIENTRGLFRFSESSVSSSFSGQTELETAYLIGGGTPRVGDHVLFPDNKSLVTYIGTVTAVNGESITVDNIEYINDALKPSGEWVMGVIANFPEVYNYQGGTYLCLGRDISTEPVKGEEWFEIAAKPLVRSVAGRTGDVTLSTEDIEGLTELLSENVNAEKERALAAEKEIKDQIAAEEGRATQEETRIASLVSAERERAEAQEGVLDAKIDTETARAKKEEGTLESAISTEQSRAMEAEQANATAITAEAQRAQDEEEKIAQSVEDEETRATGVENTLDEKITAEATRAQGAEKKVSDAVTAETSRAQEEEQTLASAIETEETRATTEENGLSGRVSTIEKKIPTAASETNKLVDRDTMNSTITSSAAFFRGSFETKAALVEWQLLNPDTATNNDYCYVQDDETQNHQAWRYIYVAEDGEWKPQFKVNNAPLNADQVKALNSGVTEELVGKITETEQGLASEISRAQGVENKNATAISSEVARAKTAEEANASAIENEEQRATAAETANKKAITDEVARAQAAEKKNADAITALQTKNSTQDTAISAAQTAAEDASEAVLTEAQRAKGEEAKKVNSDGGELANTVTTFTDATTDANIASGEKTSTIFGKIKRWFGRLKALAFKTTVSATDIDNGAVTNAKLDSDLQGAIKKANSALQSAPVTSVNGKTGAVTVEVDAESLGLADVATSGKYIDLTGAPTTLPPSGTAGGDLTGTYPNPTIGTGKITKAKLESSVQTSLGKADTALQSHQSLANYVTKTEVPPRIYYYSTKAEESGGVGTEYELYTGYFTPSSPAPVVGDLIVFNTEQFRYISSVTKVDKISLVVNVIGEMQGTSGYCRTIYITESLTTGSKVLSHTPSSNNLVLIRARQTGSDEEYINTLIPLGQRTYVYFKIKINGADDYTNRWLVSGFSDDLRFWNVYELSGFDKVQLVEVTQ